MAASCRDCAGRVHRGQGGEIVTSAAGTAQDAHLPPDPFTCDACLAQMSAPHSRRYRDLFTNCTQCGPRYTIVRALPCDRARTTMAGFAMCAKCAADYIAPADRRFHVQPLCCRGFGPGRLRRTDGSLAAIRPGDRILVSGPIGDHGIAVMFALGGRCGPVRVAGAARTALPPYEPAPLSRPRPRD